MFLVGADELQLSSGGAEQLAQRRRQHERQRSRERRPQRRRPITQSHSPAGASVHGFVVAQRRRRQHVRVDVRGDRQPNQRQVTTYFMLIGCNRVD